MSIEAPGIDEIRALSECLSQWVVRTPTVRCAALEEYIGGGTEIHAKLEFLQQTGTFKPRGALATMLSLDEQQLAAGVTAVSAGNHAIATAFAAQAVGTSAKVVMMQSANPMRVERCRDYGGEIVMAEDAHAAFQKVEDVGREEGRYFVHPFEGPHVVKGTGTVGLEICEQVPDADAVIVSIGGGGLCAGISNAVKQLRPDCLVYGVEPSGADTMRRSFESGRPEGVETVNTIADSLGAPFAAPLTFEVCRRNVDELGLVDDTDLKHWMGWLFREMKIAVEPACVASAAALAGPFLEQLRGKKVVLVMCGSNIDWATFERYADLRADDAA